MTPRKGALLIGILLLGGCGAAPGSLAPSAVPLSPNEEQAHVAVVSNTGSGFVESSSRETRPPDRCVVTVTRDKGPESPAQAERYWFLAHKVGDCGQFTGAAWSIKPQAKIRDLGFFAEIIGEPGKYALTATLPNGWATIRFEITP